MVTMVEVPKAGRVPRRPQHRFHVHSEAFAIQPFLIAPVLPGETLKSALLQARVITDPIKNPIIGWWYESYFFYVKLRDLAGREDFTEAMVNLEKDLSTYNSVADAEYHHFGGTINWSKLCLQRVVEEYFRNEGEAWDAYKIGNMPAASMMHETFTNSALLNDGYVTPDVDITVGVDDIVTASEIEESLRTWQFMRANGLTDMDYEDYLRSHGIRVAPEELHKPELLRYIREWTYPANTIDPADGSPSSAVSWAIADRIDKDRFFAEPGFIFAVSVTRPKIYLSNIDGSGVGMMTDALAWLPAIMRDDPWSSLKKFAEDKGPLQTVVSDADGYWVDVKDLLVYGDEFTNITKSAANMNVAALPNAALSNRWYPSDTDTDALFTGVPNKIKADGVVNFVILGSTMDTTPSSAR